MHINNVGAVILAGGTSRRMGQDKAMLQLDGKSFLERIADELKIFDEVLLSIDPAIHRKNCGLPIVEDIYPGCGPIAGMHAALKACKSDWLLAVSCDIPLFSYGIAEFLLSYLSDEYDAFVAVTRDGRIQPLCAIYSKRVAGILEEQLEKSDYKIVNAYSKMRIKYISLNHSAYSDEMIRNINIPQQYAEICLKKHGPPIIAVSGVKNSGKTTLLEGVLPILNECGLRVAVIKHDGHDFIPDVPGTDSFRLREAGAYGVAIYSENRYMVTEIKQNVYFKDMIKQFADADLIILEGGKNSPHPKLEVVRSAVSDTPVCAHNTLIGLCVDTCIYKAGYTVHIDDHQGVAELMLRHIEKEHLLYAKSTAI